MNNIFDSVKGMTHYLVNIIQLEPIKSYDIKPTYHTIILIV